MTTNRNLGLMERFNILRNHVKFYSKFSVAATYTVPGDFLKSNTLENVVYSALREVLNHHPILGVTILDEGTPEPKWTRLPTIDLGKIAKVVELKSSDEWIQAALREPFDVVQDLPLWRVVATTGGEKGDAVSFSLGFFCHHAIADGLSAGAFHLTFLDALNALIDGKLPLEETAIVQVPKRPLVPSLEMKTTLPIGIFFAIRKIVNTYVFSSEDPLEWSGTIISAESPRPPICNLRSFSLSAEVVGRLLKRCREEKTSMTALLEILVARKLAVLYPTHSRFTGTIPFSLRKFTGHSDRDMGCFVSNLQPRFSAEERPPWGYISCCSDSNDGPEKDDEKLWESARAVKKLTAEQTSTTTNQNVGLLKFVSDLPKLFYGMFGKKREHAFEVSNIGVLDGGVGGGKAYFDRAQFSTALSVYGDPYAISVASAKNGFITVSLNWETGVVRDENALELVRWLEDALRGLVSI
jgi:hypothetical protein